MTMVNDLAWLFSMSWPGYRQCLDLAIVNEFALLGDLTWPSSGLWLGVALGYGLAWPGYGERLGLVLFKDLAWIWSMSSPGYDL
jgi:hypothetical protein